jgi:Ca-activated chloride channel homolog
MAGALIVPSLAWPLALLLLPLPWLAARWLPRWNASPAMRLPGLVFSGASSRFAAFRVSGWPGVLAALIWLCLVVALTRPLWPVEMPADPARLPRHLLLVLDISASMDAEDLLLHGKPASRLLVAKTIAAELAGNLTGYQAGLIVFGSDAHIHTPVTRDKTALIDGLMALQTGLAGKGSALDDAIALATSRLPDKADASQLMIVLSDGDSQRSRQSTAAMPASGSKIHTLLVAGARSAAKSTADQEELSGLKEIAGQTGGAFARVSDGESLRAFLETIRQATDDGSQRPTMTEWRELYPWPLALALALSAALALLLNRRSGG